MYKILRDFEIKADNIIPTRKPKPLLIYKEKERTCYLLNFAVLVDHKMNIKEREKIDKYLN